jgi:hypothetical protein
MPVQTIISHRYDTAANWAAATPSPVLAKGEIGVVQSTNPGTIPAYFKIGDGVTSWASLPYQNLQGLQGTTGSRGLQGFQGLQGGGFNQAQGTQGAPGIQGVQGIQGLGYGQAQGVQGTQGLIGPVGLKGDTGATGPAGATGATGATGPQGSVGLQGLQGIQGVTGSPTDFYYTVASDATITFSSGTATALFPSMTTGLSLDVSSTYEFEIYAVVGYNAFTSSSGTCILSYETYFSTPTAYSTLNYRYEYVNVVDPGSNSEATVYPTIAPSSALTFTSKQMKTSTASTTMGTTGAAITASYVTTPGRSVGAYGFLRIIGAITTTSTSGAKLLPQVKFTQSGTATSANTSVGAFLVNGSFIKVKKLTAGAGGSW